MRNMEGGMGHEMGQIRQAAKIQPPEYSRDRVLQKPDGTAFPEAVDQLPIDDEVKELLKKFHGGGKDRYHLLRLLAEGRSEAEKTFAEAYIRHADNLYQSEEAQSDDHAELWYNMGKVIGGEGADTKMWWTFAPYLYEALSEGEKRVEPEEAIKRIITWTEKAATDYAYLDEVSVIHLPGLEPDKDAPKEDTTYVLGDDPDHESHIKTRQLAQEIVDKKRI